MAEKPDPAPHVPEQPTNAQASEGTPIKVTRNDIESPGQEQSGKVNDIKSSFVGTEAGRISIGYYCIKINSTG